MAEATTGARAGSGFDRALAAGLLLVLAAALVAIPAIPYPAAFERHLSALAACALVALALAGTLAGRELPLPPLPAGTLGIAGAFLFLAILPGSIQPVYSPERAWVAAGGAAGLVALSAVARGAARAGLGRALLWGSCALGAAVALIVLLESLGLDPLGAAGFYDSRRNPVATLGNPDPLANFLAPAAAAAAGLALGSQGRGRIVGFGLAAACALALGFAGVIYGYVAFACGLAVALALGARRPGAGRLGVRAALGALLLVILAAAGALARPKAPAAEAIPNDPPRAAAAERTWPIPSTLEVRVRVWVAALKLAFVYAPWGAGGGNFAIAFPRQRDPQEIELSTHFRRDGVESVVDHPHNEAILVLVETGALGALALGALLLGLNRWRRSGVFRASAESAAASAGLAAIAVASLAHAPLSETASSAVLAALWLGIVGSHDSAGAAAVPKILARPLAAILLAALPFGGYAAVNALRADLALTADRLDPRPDGERLARAVELVPWDEHAPLLLANRLRAAGQRGPALSAYREALRRNPFLVEALLNSGVILANLGDFDGADAAFAFCSTVDPNHPALRHDRAELALHRAETAREAKKDADAAALLGQAVALGADDAVLRAWGAFFYESGAYERAIPYLDRYAARHADDADSWHKLGTSFQRVGNLEASSLDFAKAHHLYALEFLRSGELDSAARSAKQYHHWALPDDAGPFVLDAAIALARGDSAAAAAALEKAEQAAASLDRRQSERQEYAKLLADPALGARARKLVK